MNIGKIDGIGAGGKIEGAQEIGNKKDAAASEGIKDFMDSMNEIQNEADAEIAKSVTGVETDISGLMIASTKAEISMQLTMSIRNKIIEAYNEIIKMPI